MRKVVELWLFEGGAKFYGESEGGGVLLLYGGGR